MTDPATHPRRTWRTVLVVTAVAVALVLAATYAGRRALAREALTVLPQPSVTVAT